MSERAAPFPAHFPRVLLGEPGSAGSEALTWFSLNPLPWWSTHFLFWVEGGGPSLTNFRLSDPMKSSKAALPIPTCAGVPLAHPVSCLCV